MCAKRYVKAHEESQFDPANFPELFDLTADRITYKKTKKGGQPKSYVLTDPEERVRAEFYGELVEKYQYPSRRIDTEVEVYRRKPEDFADIVVYEDDDLSKPYLVVECKADEVSPGVFEQAIKQAWGNANNLRAPYAAAVAGAVRFAFEAENFELANREKYAINIPVRYGKPIKYRYRKGDPEWDLKPATLDELRNRFQQCHDILWEGGRRNPAEAFDEMSKLMFCKLQDEHLGTPKSKEYKFQIGTHETAAEVAERVRKIYEDSRNLMPHVFRTAIQVSDELIYRVVETLQTTSLYRSDLDAKGRAFEKFLSSVFRGEMGQYFTPRPIVQFMVDMLEPTNKDKVIDPACGSGGFLLYSLEKLQKQADDLFDTPEERRDYWRNWALTCLHGIEINSQISRVAMMGMILHEDGHTNIRCTDALQLYDEVMKYGDTVEIKPAAFTLLMTNPPFGASVKRVTPKAGHPYLDTYELGGKVKEGDTKDRKRDSQKTEILFLERCLDLLAEKGRMGIVLPEGIFNNPSLDYVRGFVEDRAFISAVVSLPPETFLSSGASVKASLLFLTKYSNQEKRRFDAEKAKVTAETIAKYRPERERLEQEYRGRTDCYDRDELRQLLNEIKTAKDQSKQLAAKTKAEKDPARRAALATEFQSAKTRGKKLQGQMKKAITPKDRRRMKELELELRTRLRELQERTLKESRQLLKERFDYPIFVAEGKHVGITATGQEDENELPEIVKAYHRFRINAKRFIKECDEAQSKVDQPNDLLLRLFGIYFLATQRWDAKAARVALYRSAHPDYRPLGEFVEEATELVAPWEEPDKEWPVYGVDNVNGVFFSHRQLGSKFRQKYKRIRKGWFFHNPTRSAVGSLGIVPDVPEDAITSPEYQVWRLTGGFLPEFMAILLRTEAFKRLVRIHRVGAVKERLFVRNLQEIRLPVPSEAEQQQVIKAYRAAMSRLDQARSDVAVSIVKAESAVFGESS